MPFSFWNDIMKITVEEYLRKNNINLKPDQIAFPCPTQEDFNIIREFFIHDMYNSGAYWNESRKNEYLVLYKNDQWFYAAMDGSYHRNDIKKVINLPRVRNMFTDEDFIL